MRGRTDINATADEVLKCTEDLDARAKWDELFIKGSVIQDIDETHQVIHFQFKVILPFSFFYLFFFVKLMNVILESFYDGHK